MSGRLLLLCPGQGGQHGAMFDLARTDPAGSAFLAAQAPPALDRMFENRVAQPAIVAATLGAWIALRPRLAAPALVAGYSIGELAAYGVAAALAPAEAVRLAAERAALMDAAAAGAAQGLAAVSGVDVARVGAELDVAVAIITGEDSCIVGAPRAALDTLATRWPGARVQLLPVGVAAHTPLLAAAVAPFRVLLEQAPWQAPRCPVLAGVDGARVRRPDVAIDYLARQLGATIDWRACMDACAEAGITVALELGPGAALSRMLQARHPHIACRSVADFQTLDGVAAWVARQLAG